MPPFWVGFSKQRKKPGWRRSSNCVQNVFFHLFPSWPDKKNSREIKFYNFGFMPPFCVGFSKQRKKPGWRRSSNCVQNAFFQLSRSGRSEKTALGSNFTISVSCHHFGWAFPSSGKSRVDEGPPIAFKTRFFNFPDRGEAKKQPWDRILQFGFHATILGGLFQAAEKAGFTKVVQSRSKRVLLNFPIGGKRKNILGIWISQFRIHATILGGLFQAAEKAGLTKVVQLRSKRVFSIFPILARQKKQPWDQILQFRFHATILCGLFQAAEKAGLTKVLQLRSKRVFSSFPIGAKRKNSLGIEFYNFGFMPPFWVGFSKQRKKPGWRRSSNCVQNAFFQLSRSGRSEKTALGSNFTIWVSCHHFGWAFSSSGKSRVHESGPISFKTRFVKFPHRGETKKHPWDLNFSISDSCHHFGWAFPSSGKSRVDEGRAIAFKTRFFNFSHLGQTKKTAVRSNFTISVSCHHFVWIFQAAEKGGLTKVVQLRSKCVFLNFPIGAKRKNSLGIEFYNFGFMPPFLVGFFKQRKKPGSRKWSNLVQNAFC